MKQYIISEAQIELLINGLILEEAIKQEDLLKEALETNEERAERFNRRFSHKYPSGIYNSVYPFGLFGKDDIALAETKSGALIFINRDGFITSTYAIDLNKVTSRPEYLAAFMNSIIRRPLYKTVVNVYDNCTMKVIDMRDSVHIIDAMTGKILDGNEIPTNLKCVSLPPFNPDPAVIRRAQELEKKELLKKQDEKPTGVVDNSEPIHTKFRYNKKQ